MFQFRRFPSYAYLIQRRMTGYCPAGLPHSEISGSMDICSSPKLIAACHVLLRLLMPRHSPCALSSLTCSSQSPLASASAARLSASREIFARSLAPRFQRKPASLGFALDFGDGSFGFCSELSENSWFSLRIMQALQRSKLYVTLHPFGCCSTINLLRCAFAQRLSVALLAFVTLFSFQGAECVPFETPFQPLLQSDLKIRPPGQVFKSKGKSPGGPEWARTTDLTIISRTL